MYNVASTWLLFGVWFIRICNLKLHFPLIIPMKNNWSRENKNFYRYLWKEKEKTGLPTGLATDI